MGQPLLFALVLESRFPVVEKAIGDSNCRSWRAANSLGDLVASEPPVVKEHDAAAITQPSVRGLVHHPFDSSLHGTRQLEYNSLHFWPPVVFSSTLIRQEVFYVLRALRQEGIAKR